MTTDGPRDPFRDDLSSLTPVEVREIEQRIVLDKALTTVANLVIVFGFVGGVTALVWVITHW